MHDEFWDQAGGGFFMNAASTAGAKAAPVMGRPKDVNDGAVPSGNAVALHALARLTRRPGGKEEFLAAETRATALLSAFARAVNQQPLAFTYLLLAARTQMDGASGALQYAAHGNVRISGHIDANANANAGTNANANANANVGADASVLVVELKIQPGWHINAHKPLSDNLVPTTLEAGAGSPTWNLMDVSYPEPIVKALGFQSEALALYAGSVRLTVRLQQNESPPDSTPLRIKLRLQACDDKICLPPENVDLQVPAAKEPGFLISCIP